MVVVGVGFGSRRSLWATVKSVGFTLRALGSYRELGGKGVPRYDFDSLKSPPYFHALLVGGERRVLKKESSENLSGIY